MRLVRILLMTLSAMLLVGCRTIPAETEPYGIIDWPQPPMCILSIDDYGMKYHVTGGLRVTPGVHQIRFALGREIDRTSTIWSSCYLVLDLSVSEGVAYRLSADISDLRGDGALSQTVRCDIKREEMADYWRTHAPPGPRQRLPRRL
jgi:hypothetical protein